MRPPTIAELRRVALGSRFAVSVRLELDDRDVLIAFIRALTTAELDAFDLAVAAGGSPRAELVGRALYDDVEADQVPDREALIQEIERWPGWITDQLFGAALTVNRLVDRAYITHAPTYAGPAGQGATTPPAPLETRPLDPLEAEREAAIVDLLRSHGLPERPRLTPDQVHQVERILTDPRDARPTARQAEITAKAKGIMGTLESIGAFRRVTPEGASDA